MEERVCGKGEKTAKSPIKDVFTPPPPPPIGRKTVLNKLIIDLWRSGGSHEALRSKEVLHISAGSQQGVRKP